MSLILDGLILTPGGGGSGGSVVTDSSLGGNGTQGHPLHVDTDWLQDKVVLKSDTMPTAASSLEKTIILYNGETDNTYINDHMYECKELVYFDTTNWQDNIKYGNWQYVDSKHAEITPENLLEFIKTFIPNNYTQFTYGNGTYDGNTAKWTIYFNMGQLGQITLTQEELESYGWVLSPLPPEDSDRLTFYPHLIQEYSWVDITPRGGGDTIQVEVFPELTPENEGQIVEYIGQTITIPERDEVTRQETANPCTITVDVSTFHNFLESIQPGITSEEFPVMFVYRASDNSWIITGLGAVDLAEAGITVTYTTGTVEDGDSFILYHTPAEDPYYINGYFYQADQVPTESEYTAELVEITDYDISYIDKSQYEDYIVNELHEELVDANYTFVYSDTYDKWTLNSQPISLDDYGIEIIYPFIPVTNPSNYSDVNYNFSDDPGTSLSITVDLSVFESYYGPDGLNVINPDLHDLNNTYSISFKYLGLDGNNQPQWVDPIGGNITNDLSFCGVSTTFSPSIPRSSGSLGFIWHSAIDTYQRLDPTNGDTIIAQYTAASYARKWVQKEVQESGGKWKIDKWDSRKFQENESSPENEGLIVEYVGPNRNINESYTTTPSVNSQGQAQVTVTVNKNELEAGLVILDTEEALNHNYSFFIDWNRNEEYWKVSTEIDGDSESQEAINHKYTTEELTQLGIHVIIEPNISELQNCDITFEYRRGEEYPLHNGYFYQSTNVQVPGTLSVAYIDRALEEILEPANPYTLSLSTYENRQGTEERYTYFSYGETTEGSNNWYNEDADVDPNTNLPYAVNLVNDYGVTLNYKQEEHPVNRGACSLACSLRNLDRANITINTNSFENGLLTYLSGIPEKPTVYYFQCYGTVGGSSGYFRVNGQDISEGGRNAIDMSTAFGFGFSEVSRASTFEDHDWVTVYYTPTLNDYDNPLYCMVEGNFENCYPDTNGGYIASMDAFVLQQTLGTLPTELTYYTWECIDGDSNKWTLDGVSANPEDYGITLSERTRAPQTPFVTGDTFKVMFSPAHEAVYMIAKQYFQFSSDGFGITNLDVDTLKRNVLSNPSYYTEGNLFRATFYNSSEGSYSESRWTWEQFGITFDADALYSTFGITLANPRAPAGYMQGDFFILEYMPYPESNTATPEVGDHFEIYHTAPYNYYDWVQKDVQPKEGLDTEHIIIKSKTIPRASETVFGRVYMYMGETNETYTHGYVYECVIVPSHMELTVQDIQDYPGTVTTNNALLLQWIKEVARDHTIDVAKISGGYNGRDRVWNFYYFDDYDQTIVSDTTISDDHIADIGLGFSPAPEDGWKVNIDVKITETDASYGWVRFNVQPDGGAGSIQTDSSLSGSGSEEDPLQVSEGWLDNRIIVKAPIMPTASTDLIGQIYMYTGADIAHSYTHGYIYECQGSATGLTIDWRSSSGFSSLDETVFMNYLETIARDPTTIRGATCSPVGNNWKISVSVDGTDIDIGVRYSVYVQSMGFQGFTEGTPIKLVCSYTRPYAEWVRIDVQPTGTVNYNDLSNKPAIDGQTLTSSSTKQGLGISGVYLRTWGENE